MASYLSWVASAVGGTRNPLADFAYALGEPAETSATFPSLWALHHGTRKSDKTPVSFFVFDAAGGKGDKLILAKNALKRSRTLRHPNLLPYLDSLETETALYIVTPHVVPLSLRLDETRQSEQLLSWGLYQILKAISFLTEDAGLVHGAVAVNSVFVDDAGELKLGGFDVLCGMKDENNMVLNYYDLIPWLQKYKPPEILKQGWTALRTGPAWAVDVWYFGCLVFELYNGSFQKIDQIKTKGQIPEALYAIYKDIMKGDPKLRPAPSQILERGSTKGGFLHNDFIQANLFLENFALKEAYEKDQFFRKLTDAIDSFPVNFCKYKLLPELVKSLEFGSAGSRVIGPLMKIGAMLTSEEYESKIVSAVVKMFAQTDRAMRLSLLDNLPSFIEHLSSKLVCQNIFAHVCTGLLDTQPTMREATIKSMVLFAPKLGTKEMDDLLRYFAKTQLDEEPGIRTNTTICLGRLSEHMNEATKKRVLIPAFTRSLKDPFAPGRTAGISSFHATKDMHATEDIACKIIPVLSPLLVDPELSVRQQAFKTVSVFLKIMENSIREGAAAASAGDKKQETTKTDASTEGGWLSSFTRTFIGGNIVPTSPSTSTAPVTTPPPLSTSAETKAPANKPAPTNGGSTPSPELKANGVSSKNIAALSRRDHAVATMGKDNDEEDDDDFAPMDDVPSFSTNLRTSSATASKSTATIGTKSQAGSLPTSRLPSSSAADGWDDDNLAGLLGEDTSPRPSTTAAAVPGPKTTKSPPPTDERNQVAAPGSWATATSITVSSSVATKPMSMTSSFGDGNDAWDDLLNSSGPRVDDDETRRKREELRKKQEERRKAAQARTAGSSRLGVVRKSE